MSVRHALNRAGVEPIAWHNGLAPGFYGIDDPAVLHVRGKSAFDRGRSTLERQRSEKNYRHEAI